MRKKYEDMMPEEKREADLEKAIKDGEQFEVDLEKAIKDGEQFEVDLEKAIKDGEQFEADLEKARKDSRQAIILTLVAIAINIFNIIRILIEAYQQVR